MYENEIRKANALKKFEETMNSLHRDSEVAKGALVVLHSRLGSLQDELEEALVAEDAPAAGEESPRQVIEKRAERVAVVEAVLVMTQAKRVAVRAAVLTNNSESTSGVTGRESSSGSSSAHRW